MMYDNIDSNCYAIMKVKFPLIVPLCLIVLIEYIIIMTVNYVPRVCMFISSAVHWLVDLICVAIQ